LAWAALVVAVALLETTWLEAVRVMDVVPDLTLLLVVYFAIANGPERAMFTGVLGGLFQDVARNAVLGHNVLCYVVVGYVSGRIATRLATEHPAVKSGLVFMASLALGLLSIIILYVQDPGISALNNIVARVVPGAFYTALFTPVLFFALDRSFRRSEWAFHGGAV
jgi:rod shape-determining protein MreD